MKVAGEAVLHAPVDQVWNALLDPEVLVRTLPGCERLETTGENRYAMTVTAGVASVRGTYSGTCELLDLRPHDSLVLKASGAGAPGTIAADVKVAFAANGDGTTRLSYDADAAVGGMIGGVGQRMLTSVSKRMAGEFFGAVDQVLTGAVPAGAPAGAPAVAPVGAGAPPGPAAGAAPAAPAPGQTFVAPPRPTATGTSREFLTGALLGAGLVLAGVVAGALAGRRR
ncbi:MAG TPA: carbon monoxide dehydrogenase subunit G [Nocardioidaceae bacterium]|jgi:carbon monoxide dehydrogenase subunit G